MSTDSESTFTFSPRPEAHAMNWEELLPPVRRAIRDLLLRIDGATRKEAKGQRAKDKEAKGCEITANCFLVHGDRGTGKTTVLLSAKYACESKKKFFGEDEHKQENSADNVRRDAMNSAEELKKNVVWLDVLDLEPLPPRANLLTTVLTRVRNALDFPGSEKPSAEATSILEEGADSARNTLKQLINDATLMWEDIHEQDTRSRANRQVAAADIYARFQKRFQNAMDTLSGELCRRSGRADTYLHVVLPIDNIDRSTEHLYSIVKLAQMVFCPRLWLVMAGDRQDVDDFLERAYWKELIRIGEEGAGATGKTGVSGEDEALVMARRQAAAASHRLLPPSHRVEVGLVEPDETLEFKLPGVSEQSGADKNIRELLENVRLITTEKAAQKLEITDQSLQNLQSEGIPDDVRKKLESIKNREMIGEKQFFDIIEERIGKEKAAQYNSLILKHANEGQRKIRLIDLFDAQQLIKGHEDKNDTSYFTETAKLGLRLPARGVLDLWQLAYWVTKDHTIKEHLKAEKIARTMLRNVVTESSMSSEMGRLLQDKIIRRNPQGGTMLDFEPPNPQLQVLRLRSSDFDLPTVLSSPTNLSSPTKSYAMKSVLAVTQVNAVMLKLTLPPGSPHEEDALLPDLVSAWLTVLYDTLVWGAEDSDIISGPEIRPVNIVYCRHWGVAIGREQQRHWIRSIAGWPVPDWRSFIAHDIFWQLWRDCLTNLKTTGLSVLPPRMLATGWVACVLETFMVFANLLFVNLWKEWKGPSGFMTELKYTISDREQHKQVRIETIKGFEKKVMECAANVYDKITTDKSQERDYLANKAIGPMRDWLEWDLPLLLSYFFVPMSHDEVKVRAEETKNFLEKKKLGQFWKHNVPDILFPIDWEERDFSEPFNDLQPLWSVSKRRRVSKTLVG